jgi:hypothetical protein
MLLLETDSLRSDKLDFIKKPKLYDYKYEGKP